MTGDPYSPVDRLLGLIFLSELRGAKKGLEAIGAAIDAVGGLSNIGRKGGRGIREVVGGESDARDLFDYLRGDNDFYPDPDNPDVLLAPVKGRENERIRVTFRPKSGDKPPTVDVHGIEKGVRKIKFVQE